MLEFLEHPVVGISGQSGPVGRALVWANIRVMNTAIWALVTQPSGENVVAEVPWVTPIL